jgi:hypothetical protein
MATLDAAGLGDGCRERRFVELGSTAAAAAVAAVREHGFARALAVAEPAVVPVLRANLILNDVDDLVEAASAVPADGADVGLLWLPDRTLLAAAEPLLAAGCPAVLVDGSEPAGRSHAVELPGGARLVR